MNAMEGKRNISTKGICWAYEVIKRNVRNDLKICKHVTNKIRRSGRNNKWVTRGEVSSILWLRQERIIKIEVFNTNAMRRNDAISKPSYWSFFEVVEALVSIVKFVAMPLDEL